LIDFARSNRNARHQPICDIASEEEIAGNPRLEFRGEKIDNRKTRNFEERARYKMKEMPKRKLARKDKPPVKKAKRKGKGEVAARNVTDALVEGFATDNISDQRITVCGSWR